MAMMPGTGIAQPMVSPRATHVVVAARPESHDAQVAWPIQMPSTTWSSDPRVGTPSATPSGLSPSLVAEAKVSTARIVATLGASGIPEVALRAYVRGEQTTAITDPSCGLRWWLLAAIGRVESNHGRFGGARLLDDGYGRGRSEVSPSTVAREWR